MESKLFLFSILVFCMIDFCVTESEDESCEGRSFETRLVGDAGCQPRMCKDGKWHDLPAIEGREQCCKGFKKRCLEQECSAHSNFEFVTHQEYSISCVCGEHDLISCNKWYNRRETCNIIGALCECEAKEEKGMKLSEKEDKRLKLLGKHEGCYVCKCKDRMWKCDEKDTHDVKICCEKWDIGCGRCCPGGNLAIDLENMTKRGKTKDVKIEEQMVDQTALVGMKFDGLDICGKEPMCGKRQIRINATITAGNKNGVLLDIKAGPGRVSVEGSNLHIRKPDCEENDVTLYDVIPHGESEMRLHVGNNYIKVRFGSSDVQIDRCHKECFFNLKDDNSELLVGINRAVDDNRPEDKPSDALVSAVTFHWVCPNSRSDYKEYRLDQM